MHAEVVTRRPAISADAMPAGSINEHLTHACNNTPMLLICQPWTRWQGNQDGPGKRITP